MTSNAIKGLATFAKTQANKVKIKTPHFCLPPPLPTKPIPVALTQREVNLNYLGETAVGTLAYHGYPVYVYRRMQINKAYFDEIKDEMNAGDAVPDKSPRVHFMLCSTLTDSVKEEKIAKFFCTQETIGIFDIDLFDRDEGSFLDQISLRLLPCTHCLKLYHNDPKIYKGDKRVNQFSFVDFSVSRGDLFAPTWRNRTAKQIGEKNWDNLSNALRKKANLTCQNRACNFKAKAHQKGYLEVHHKNRDPSNNHPSNLEVLCTRCHAEQPGHHHLKNEDKYHRFMKMLNQ